MITLDTPPREQSLDGATDTRLVSLCLAGDENAFAAIMRRNNQRLFRVARSILKDDAEAEDAVQESYLKAFLHLDTFQGRSTLSTWLTRLAINESLGRIRHQHRHEQVRLADIDDWSAGNAWSKMIAMSLGDNQPERNMAQTELRQILEDAIDRLPEKFRPVFVMRDVEGMSGRETAEILDIPEATVKTRCFRARRLLRKDLRRRLQGDLTQTFPFLSLRCDRMVAGVLARLREKNAMGP